MAQSKEDQDKNLFKIQSYSEQQAGSPCEGVSYKQGNSEWIKINLKHDLLNHNTVDSRVAELPIL